MADIEQKIQEGIQVALKKKEDQERFAARFGWALLFGALSGYVVWSKFWIFSLYDNMLFWVIGIGAIVGFFIYELLLLAAIGLVGVVVYSYFLQSQHRTSPSDLQQSSSSRSIAKADINVTITDDELDEVSNNDFAAIARKGRADGLISSYEIDDVLPETRKRFVDFLRSDQAKKISKNTKTGLLSLFERK